jgi:hypothetical protein
VVENIVRALDKHLANLAGGARAAIPQAPRPAGEPR